MGKEKQHKDQGINLNVERFTTDGAAAIITAWQSGVSATDNEHAHTSLRHAAVKMGYGVTTLEGHWGQSAHQTKDEPEKAMLLVGSESDSGNMKGFLKKMMAEYGQMSVVYKAARRSEIVLLSADGSQPPIAIPELQKFSGVYQQMRQVNEARFFLDGISVAKNWIGNLAEQVSKKRRH